MARCAFMITVLFASAASAATPSFQGLGTLPGSTGSAAWGISPDGSTVVGSVGSQGFRWTSSGGMQGIGNLPGRSNSFPRDASGDGSVIVGSSFSSSGGEAFRWTQSGGMQPLGHLAGFSSSSVARGISDDGSVIVGSSSNDTASQAFRWSSSQGMQPLAGVVGYGAGASGVSADGSVVVGSHTNSAGNTEAFRWTSSGGLQGLGDLAGGEFFSIASDISADGLTIVGHGRPALNAQAFRWTTAGGMQGLGYLPGFGHTEALDVSGDGSIIVGQASGSVAGGDDRTAFIWDATHGIRGLQDVLVNDYGLDLTGWTLRPAQGISADGTTIVGWGINPAGQTEAWRAVIPEPSSLSLLALAGVALVRRRRC